MYRFNNRLLKLLQAEAQCNAQHLKLKFNLTLIQYRTVSSWFRDSTATTTTATYRNAAAVDYEATL